MLTTLAPTLGNIDDSDLQPALQLLAGSGNFDGNNQNCEAQNLIDFGHALNIQGLPPQYGGIDRSAFFDSPRDLFIVVYLQPLARRCALPSDDCKVNGRSPTDIFLDKDDYGGVTWLSFTNGTHLPLAGGAGGDRHCRGAEPDRFRDQVQSCHRAFRSTCSTTSARRRTPTSTH